MSMARSLVWRRRNGRSLSLAVVAALLAGYWGSGDVEACGVAPPRNQTVQIADESAIIVWDEASKTQHFIRRASFTTGAKDFGFLVPTPARPELAEAGDDAFKVLAKATEPRVVTRTRPAAPAPGCGCGGAAPRDQSATPAPPAVTVLDEKRVAGHDAVVLKADDPKALSKWLEKHGYDFSPALTAWLEPYVKAGWVVSAFKVAKSGPEDPGVATQAVRMTFKTEKPFFPYREPAAPPGQQAFGNRLLRVYFLADRRYFGGIGEKSDPWPGQTVWANKLADADLEKVRGHLKLPAQAVVNGWLTEFEDRSSPRPGTADVYFLPSTNQSTVERPPIIRFVSLPSGDMLLCACLLGMLFVGSRLRRNAPSRA